MKRKTVLILLLVVILSIGCGCSQKHTAENHATENHATENRATENSATEYQCAYELYRNISNTDSAAKEGVAESHPLWTLEKSDSGNVEPKQTVEVTFEGKVYEGEFWYSAVIRHNPYTSHYYLFPGGWFSVKSTTGELDYFCNIATSDTEIIKTAEECERTALTLASKYINTEEYKMSVKQEAGCYNYLFERYIEGIRTDAFLSVGVNYSGDIKFFSYGSTDEMTAAINNIEKEMLKGTLATYTSNDVVSKIYNAEQTRTQKTAKIEIEGPVLVVLEDGTLGVVYQVELERVSQDGEGALHFGEQVKYIVGPTQND